MKKDTLYYDGACPLCTAEMKHLRNLADADLNLVDIHELQMDAGRREELLRVLHFETVGGKNLTGLDATVAAWQHTRIGFLWRWLRWPVIRAVADKVYARWAVSRFSRLYGQRESEFSQR
jgi:predicted DCC family thiol-disulfide oxidoreductase YuxK